MALGVVEQRLLDDVMFLVTGAVEGMDDICRERCTEIVANPNRAWSVLNALTSMNRDLLRQVSGRDPERLAGLLGAIRDEIEQVLEDHTGGTR
ncbi:MAG: hypothetical protein KA755_01570 [Candidatus Microthrix sp.]|nr:hypothetical protein [Candidatus Microthrix sp.]